MTSIQEALEVERSRLQTTLHKLMGGEAISTTSSSDQVDPQWIQTLHIRRKVSVAIVTIIMVIVAMTMCRNCWIKKRVDFSRSKNLVREDQQLLKIE